MVVIMWQWGLCDSDVSDYVLVIMWGDGWPNLVAVVVTTRTSGTYYHSSYELSSCLWPCIHYTMCELAAC